MFENIIGNDKIKQTLEKSVKLNKTAHSYLFIGTDGIGKKLIAKEFAKMLLCLDEENKYCNKCKSCIEFSSNNNPDFIFIEPEEKNIKINQIREILSKTAEKPIISSRKIYVINDADTMTEEAQNCLLKTLEEPPEYVTIILIGSNENSFLSTIKSRCTIMHFSNIDDNDIKKYLSNEFQITDISENMLELIQGSIGKAIKLKEKKDLYSKVDKTIETLDKSDLIDTIKSAEIMYTSKDEISDILEYINVTLFNKAKHDIRYINTISIIEEAKKRLKANSNYDMCIDNMLFNIWREVNERYSRS